MRLTSFLVWKSWASSPFRVLLTWLGIALGVGVVAAIHILDHNTILTEQLRLRGDLGVVDCELLPRDPKIGFAAHLQRLRKREDVARVALFTETRVRVLQDGEVAEEIPLYSVESEESFGHYRVESGRDLDVLDGESVVLATETLLQRLGRRVGDRIVLRSLPRDTGTVCVDGKLVPGATDAGPDPEIEVEIGATLSSQGLGRRNAGLVLVGRQSLARKIGTAPRSVLQVVRRSGEDVDAFLRSLREDYLVLHDRQALIGEAADERAFRNGVKVLGCLALVLGMFVIFHTLSHSLAERVRTIGLLRCIGATSRQISAVFVTDAVVLSVLGALGGLVLGAVIAKGLGMLHITTLGLGKSVRTFEIPWDALLPIGALGILFTWLGAAFPLLKLRNLEPRKILYVRDMAPPADLLRGVNLFLFAILVFALPLAYLAMTPLLDPSGSGAGIVLLEAVGIVGLFFAVLLLSPRVVRLLGGFPLWVLGGRWPLQSFLLRKRLIHAPGKVATSICGLSLVALAALGHHSLTAALRGEVRAFAAVGMNDKVFLDFREGLAPEHLQELRASEGAASVLPLTRTGVLGFEVAGTDATELANAGGPLEGRPELVRAMQEGRGLVISERLAALRGLRVGSRKSVALPRGIVEYEVLEISDVEGFYPDERAFGLVDRRWLEKDFCLETDEPTRFSVRLRPGADEAAVLASAEALPRELLRVRRGRDIAEFHVQDVARDFFFFDILLGLLFVLAGLGQLNLITLQGIARAREIGILRAFGATRGDFVRLLMLEALVVGFLAALLAIAAGVPLSWVLVSGLRGVSGLDAPWILPWRPALLVGGVAVGVSLLAALLPSWRMTGLPPARAVRSTE